MRKALIVGINYYKFALPLNECVRDAYKVNEVISNNSDGTRNFDTRLCVAFNEVSMISKSELKNLVKELFKDDNDVALFYFSGHGFIETYGGYLCTSEIESGDDGFSMSDLLQIINNSKAKNRVVILDTCHSGAMGVVDQSTQVTEIKEGVTILTASRATESALETIYGGVFTNLFVDALNGAASNLLGDVSPGSVYSHIDLSLGAWDQRPIFKTNVKNFISLRKTQAPILLSELKMLSDIFDSSYIVHLDPSFEPTSINPSKDNTEVFALLQKFAKVNLVVPVGAEHMYFAAMESKSCKLTVLGEFYWRLINDNLL